MQRTFEEKGVRYCGSCGRTHPISILVPNKYGIPTYCPYKGKMTRSKPKKKPMLSGIQLKVRTNEIH